MTLPASLANLVWEQSASTGSSNLTVSRRGGYQTGAEAFGTADSSARNPYVFIVNTNSTSAQWEICKAFWSSATTLVRGQLVLSSNSNNRVTFGAGTKFITNDVPASFQTGTISTSVSVLSFGAMGDGVTNDASAFSAAISFVSALGGGVVWVPPTGAAYVIGTGFTLPAGVHLQGPGTMNFLGHSATLAQWAASGSWIQFTDTVNFGISMNGHGCRVSGINFIYNQPAPSGPTYTPTTFPYTIGVDASLFSIENVLILGATHGITINYTTGSGGGTFSYINNIYLACFNVGLQTEHVNDTMQITNIRVRPFWYVLDGSVLTYTLTNLVGWDCHYMDNPIVNGFEVFAAADALVVTDGTTSSVTHSLVVAQIHGFSANLCRRAIRVTATDTNITAYFSNFIAQSAADAFASQGGGTYNDTLIQLQSDEVEVKFSNFTVPVAASNVMTLGSSGGGRVQIENMDIGAYETISANQGAFITNANAELLLGGTKIIEQSSTNNPYFAGTGLVHGDEQLILSGTISSAATLPISWNNYRGYNGYRLDLINFIPAVDATQLQMTVSANSSTFDTSSTAYSYAANLTDSGGTNSPFGAPADSRILLTHPSSTAGVGNQSNEGGSWSVWLPDVLNTAVIPKVTYESVYFDQSGRTMSVYGTGIRLASQRTLAVSLSFSSGAITSGKWRLTGLL